MSAQDDQMMPRKFADELFSAHYLSVIEGCCEDDKTAALSTMAIKRRLLKLGVDIHSTAVQASTKVELRQMLLFITSLTKAWPVGCGCTT